MVSKVKKALNKGSGRLKSLKIKVFRNQGLLIQNAKELLKETLAVHEERLEACYEEIEILNKKLQEETAKGNIFRVVVESRKKEIEYKQADHIINEIGILLREESRMDSALMCLDTFRCLKLAISAATSAIEEAKRDAKKAPGAVAALQDKQKARVACVQTLIASDGN